MKKLLLTLLLVIFMIPRVNAEEITLDISPYTFEDFYEKTVTYNDENIRLYDYFMNIFNSQTEYKYYIMDYYSYNEPFYNTHFVMFNDYSYTVTATSSNINIDMLFDGMIYGYHGDFYSHSITTYSFEPVISEYRFLDSNIDLYLSGASYNINGLYNTTIKLNSGDKIPTLKDLSNEEIKNNYINGEGGYTEVNLDNYEYVLLSLKDYTKKESFSTAMKVKGSIGITPIYEYGTVEKSTITDICNISYDDFTDFRFTILKNDLINSAVYAVKSCEENSSFKFKSNIFNITYVTADNVDDPVVTIGGVEYHTIPFSNLSNTVNKNTEEGFIPGESEGFTPIEDLVNYVSSFWKSLSTFMGLVTKFFNTLPLEIRAVCITFFTTACTLGILKILKN